MIWQRLAITTISTLCVIFNLISGGNISIQKHDNKTGELSYECGRNATLTCNFKKSTFAISWMNATDVIPIVKCTHNSQNKCFLTPDYEGQYRFTYDIQGSFNLTVIKITKEDNGRKLICSDGSDSDYEVIKVTDYEPLLLEDTINGTVGAISGCISQHTEVYFKWIKVSVSSGIEEEIIPTIHNNYTRRCSNDSDCGNDQHVQYTETISAKSSDNGKYFLKVLAVYENASKESCNSAYKYLIEEHDKRIIIAVGIGIAVLSVAILLTGYYVWKCWKRRRKKERESKRFQMHEEEYTQNGLLEKEKERDTPTYPNEDKTPPNEGDIMELKKEQFDRRRRHRHPEAVHV
ncbi:uncharacterized protein LOC132731017 isoform X2 [Ruditapes philippinarum]|uniref:uncharacterized protein LOC132731017 isoform X2 n=1 Tax=Ruditapes philippinarum TaxID=129788 RepID=UPI00295A64A3|nr:uncharacterized protein LOC132731017 isoform X2 [Ruditapes philippinarum]